MPSYNKSTLIFGQKDFIVLDYREQCACDTILSAMEQLYREGKDYYPKDVLVKEAIQRRANGFVTKRLINRMIVWLNCSEPPVLYQLDNFGKRQVATGQEQGRHIRGVRREGSNPVYP